MLPNGCRVVPDHQRTRRGAVKHIQTSRALFLRVRRDISVRNFVLILDDDTHSPTTVGSTHHAQTNFGLEVRNPYCRAGKREDAIIWYTNEAKSPKSVWLRGRTSVWKPLIRYRFHAGVRATFEKSCFLNFWQKSPPKCLQNGSPNVLPVSLNLTFWVFFSGTLKIMISNYQ